MALYGCDKRSVVLIRERGGTHSISLLLLLLREQRKQAVKRISFHYRGNLLKFITDYRATHAIPLLGRG